MLKEAVTWTLTVVVLLIVLPMAYILAGAVKNHLSARWEAAALCEKVNEGDAAHETVQLFFEHSCSFSEDERPRFPMWCIYDDRGASKCFSECPAMSPVVPQDGEVSYTQMGPTSIDTPARSASTTGVFRLRSGTFGTEACRPGLLLLARRLRI